MCASTVSSKMLAAMAHREGFHFEETLTGFKWIGSRLLTLQSQGFRVLFGYEEAIGFSCGGIIPDKDGISALGIIAKMASWLYSRGETVSIYLRKIHDKYGEFCSHNGYYRCNDPAIVSRILKQMRNGGEYFDRVGTYDVESIRDLGSPGYDSTTDDKRPTLPTSASSPMITFRFVNGCVAQFRASGTEPKFKYYIELRGKPGEMRSDVEMRLTEMSRTILEELLRPSENGLILPSNL
jgi:phosphomannomutase